MKKIIITVVLGLMAASLVGFLYFRNISTDMQGSADGVIPSATSTLASANPDQIKGKNSLMSLFALGKSMECTFVFSSDGMRGEGTGFFNNGNARVDSLYTATGSAPTASYMITDATNKVMYTWTLQDDVAQGVKMAIPTETATTDTMSDPRQNPAGTVTPNTDVEYDCKPWTVDNSVFVPPRDVTFMDMTIMQEQMEVMQKDMEALRVPSR